MRACPSFLTVLAFLLSTLAVDAHEPGLSTLRLAPGEMGMALEVQLAPRDADSLVRLDTDDDGEISRIEFAAGIPALRELTRTWATLARNGGDAVEVFAHEPAFDPSASNIVLRAHVPSEPRAAWQLSFPQLANLPPGHRHFVSVEPGGGREPIQALLTARDPTWTFTWPAAEARPTERRGTAAAFVLLGIEHILTGYDHLLYLAGLIIVCRRLGATVAIVTSFTVAHSFTLAMAALGIVELPSRIVEPLIAVSIAFVGLQNMWLRGREPRWRELIAFGFGLIHGFGFAGLLRELGVGGADQAIFVPLLSFNIGVELGQLALVLLALPLLAWARRRESFVRCGVPASSAVIALAGGYWFVERVWW